MSRKINPLGIMSYVYLEYPADDIAAEIASQDIKIIQVDPRQKGFLDDQGEFNSKRAKEVREIFAEQGVSIPVLSAYMNLVHPDLEKRESNLKSMEKMIKLAPEYGASFIATETGSFHPTNQWRDHPNNHTESAWETLVTITERLRKTAEENGVTLLLEGYVNNVLNTAKKGKELIQTLGTKGLGLVMDPFNLMTEEDLNNQEKAMEKIISNIMTYSPIAHAKDVIYTEKGISTPCAGTGKAQWHLYAEALSKHAPSIPLFMEHLKPEEVNECVNFIRKTYDMVSI